MCNVTIKTNFFTYLILSKNIIQQNEFSECI